MRRRLSSALVALALTACGAIAAPAMGEEWHSQQPLTVGSEVPVSLGKVYDIEFWAPNRGLLITADGLWAYDGTSWHRLSTVCGGTGGRIAWAGPLDFWTISDQVAGQGGLLIESGAQRSLCHFVNGAVVASYAQPIGLAGSYEQMNAAACLAPDDCWFGGERLPGTVNTGAFHLHWDGRELSPVPSLMVREPEIGDPDRAVADLAVHEGGLYESVRVDSGHVAGEPDDRPYVLHEIFPGSPPAFVPLLPSSPIDYGGQPSYLLSPLQLSGDEEELWAAAGGNDCCTPVPVTILRLGPEGFAPLTLNDPGGLLNPTVRVNAIAAEPGAAAAWVAYRRGDEVGNAAPFSARLVLVHADGTVGEEAVLPTAGEGLARKERADRLACPGPEQCWMSTETGWLFHLGGDLPRDEDPAMHRLITYRPPDGSTLVLPLDTLPDQESEASRFAEEPPLRPEPLPHHRRQRQLVLGVHQRVVGGTTVELRFSLAARARVQLVAKRGKKVVASTKRATLSKGKHVLRLRLNPKHWPTKLDLRAKRVKR